MEYALLIIGFVLLIKGADFFVDGAASVAYKFSIPSVIVGLTIVALGTSLPEFSVSLTASLAHSNELAVSNVVGSNIFNTLIVVGASALIAPFAISKTVINRDLSINILVSLLLVLFVLNGDISRIDGIIFVIVLIAYLSLLIRSALQNKTEVSEESPEEQPLSKSILFIIGGAVLILVGGDLTVDAARKIALSLGMTETLVGLTVVALGTSLPELVTSVVAAKKGESGLSLGNAIGSNILNILFILGFSSIITPLPVTFFNQIDTMILLGIAVLFFVLAKLKSEMSRSRGVLLIVIYAVYLAYIIARNYM